MKSIKKIAILGSTGSIGKTTLKIIKKNKSKFKIILLTANKNYKALIKQTREFKVQNVIITNKTSYNKFKSINKNPNIKIFNNFKNLDKIFKSKVDYTMCSIVGIDGLEPTLKLIKFTKIIAIANKESIICGWNIIKKKLKIFKTKLIPVDSEHFSIWYALRNNNTTNISKVFLTASGGPLLTFSKNKIKNINIKDVLKHPNWKMGNKITVDSSTMMNKVFEIIEARNIFDLSLKKLSILIHPKSYVHAILKFNDGMIKIVAHHTTMEIPITNSIYNTKINSIIKNNLDIQKLNNLNFSKVNYNKYPSVKILKLLPDKFSLFETIMVSANDELVRLFLKKKIKYNEIVQKLLKLISSKEFLKYKKKLPNSISEIVKLDRYVRLKINSKGV